MGLLRNPSRSVSLSALATVLVLILAVLYSDDEWLHSIGFPSRAEFGKSPSSLRSFKSSSFSSVYDRTGIDLTASEEDITTTASAQQPYPPSTHHSEASVMTSAAAKATTAGAQTMRAVVVHEAGGPEVLRYHTAWPKPTPSPGQVLIRVKAFGLNRAEMFTRQGHSPGVSFPRILGIEAAGIVEAAPGSETRLPVGSTVVTCMGNMGRMYDGGYAEYTVVDASQVKRISAASAAIIGDHDGSDKKLGGLSWAALGALPETMQTAWGSLFGPLQLKAGDKLLIRGGTTTIGLAAASLAKRHGAFVVATTRNESRAATLREHGVDDVLVDPTGVAIAEEAAKRYPDGFDKILELVGVVSMADSLKCLKKGGIQCMTGIAGGKWVLDSFSPIPTIPKGRYLTTYGGSSDDLLSMPFDEIVDAFARGELKMPIRSFKIEDISSAHKFMEFEGGAKAVVLVP